MSDSDTIISVEDLSKRYRLGQIGATTLRESAERLWHRLRGRDPDAYMGTVSASGLGPPDPRTKEQGAGNASRSAAIWALRDICLEVKRGEVLGIIGKNGAGKSTLLKILSRVTEPTAGRAVLHGRVGSLLEVGTGFHPELTGRENVYLNGAILGMKRREIDAKFDEIVAFAEIEKFIDTPVKRYSSGMYVRLAFAVAAHLDPEILLVDEVLAVGDAAFRRKCIGKMGDVALAGKTVLFVSHNMGVINALCSRCILFEGGRLVSQGRTDEVVSEYGRRVSGSDRGTRTSVSFAPEPEKPVQILSVSLGDRAGEDGRELGYDEPQIVDIHFSVRQPSRQYYAVLFVTDGLGNTILFTADDDLRESAIRGVAVGEYRYRVELPPRLLKPGRYAVTASLTKGHGPIDRRDSCIDFEIVDEHSRRGRNNGYRRQAMVAPELPWQLARMSDAGEHRPASSE